MTHGSGALRPSEARFHGPFGCGPIGLAQVDLQGHIRTANDDLQELLGYSEQELCSMTLAALTHPEDRAADRALFQDVVGGTRHGYSREQRYIRKDAATIWGTLIVCVSRAADGSVDGLVGMLHEGTRQRRTEEHERANVERYRRQLECSSDALALLDLNHHIQLANTQAAALFHQATPDALIGRNLLDLLHPIDRGRAAGAFRAVAAGALLSTQTYTVQRHDSSTFSLELHATWVNATVANAVGQVLLIGHDTTSRTEAAERLLAERDLLQTVMDAVPDAIYVEDAQLRFVRVNMAHARLLGAATTEELIGKSDFDYFPPELARQFGEQEHRIIASGEPVLNDLEDQSNISHGPRWILASKVPLWQGGKIAGLVGISRDVTDLRAAEEAVRASEERFRVQYRDFPLATFTWRRLGNEWIYAECNSAADTLTGGSLRAQLGRSANELLAPMPQALEMLERCARTSGIIRGERTWHFSTHSSPSDVFETWVPVAPDLIMQHVEDVTEHKRTQEDLRHLALHDSLTGLPNRTLLHTRISAGLHEGSQGAHPLALLLLDLDHFKEVNDTFGHYLGDAILRETTARLLAIVPTGTTVARLGGDEFAVLLPGADMLKAIRVAVDLRTTLDTPVFVNGHLLHVAASVGIALAPVHGVDEVTLLRRADMAMYTAKRGRLGYAVYEPSQDQYSPERLARITELHEAIDSGALTLHYQPQLDFASGHVSGVEALVRWPHPIHGLIPPDQFVPLAEQTGLIAPLTEWVLGEAIRQCRAWHQVGLPLCVSVNLSMWNLLDPTLPARLAALLQQHELAPAWLRLELTESALMADMGRAATVLARLSGLGLRLSVDDFGAGYSSLAYLKKLPVDALKIDKGFVREMATTTTDASIVASTVGLGHALGLQVVAEGIEDRMTWDLLLGMGCDVAQGYYLSRPLPAEVLEQWMRLRSEEASQATES